MLWSQGEGRLAALRQRGSIWPLLQAWEEGMPYWGYSGPSELEERASRTRQRAEQVLAWFEHYPDVRDLPGATRPESLSPDWPSARPDFDLLSSYSCKLHEVVVSSVCDKRAAILAGRSGPNLLSLRFLIYEPEEQVSDGSSAYASKGFSDDFDEPGWATWIDSYRDPDLGVRLLCCVPPCLVEAAQAGIDANPVDCIHWADCPGLF